MTNIEQTSKENPTFEDFKNENGLTYWWASDLMNMLGYPNMKSFEKVLNRATKAFVSLNIPHYDNILVEQREKNGEIVQDFKLTRFACYLTVMNGDPKKAEVAKAQSYFAQQTRKFELYFQSNDEIDRILIREELTEGNKSLASAANQAGVVDFAKFQNAGYLGMYNMKSWQHNYKNINGKSRSRCRFYDDSLQPSQTHINNWHKTSDRAVQNFVIVVFG